ncbi:hypothetical protein SAMN05216462_1822 [Xylanibacter ruminicola]|uniref:Uncharacterized protein n=1 Tax=Xylanibacter ruminicola TaxID=839 RepID=A0A1H4C833_XYLRU|nr:hypothetical protein [Xylanibacter ruminicola]SEA56571.1 hypothetical protein SAMN05216462_1822 [Xylanibacter ruminicola]
MKRYYYIDDEVDTIKSIADGINECKLVQVDVFPLGKHKEFDNLTERLRSEWDNFDGLILDLKLDGGGVDSTKFTATSLAQWISSYVIAERKAAKPLVLLSNDLECANFKADITSHDLFDMVLERSGGLKWDWFAKVLAIIAEGYDKLNNDKEKKLSNLLQWDSIDTTATYFAPFTDLASFNVREFASFILNDLFLHPGLLISEPLLAARYGVDMEKSGEGWQRFKTKYLEVAKYRGLFGEIANCYWSKKTQEVFMTLSGGKSAASLTTIQRVKALKDKAEDASGLIAYEPADKDASTYCWAIDEVTRKPLDSSEGYMIQEEGGLKSWQEPRFVSFDTIESGNLGEVRLVPSEKERYEEDLAALED